MKLAARTGDHVGGHGGALPDAAQQAGAPGVPCARVLGGFARVEVESAPAARIGDLVGHGRARLDDGSARVLIGGMAASRADDPSTCGGRIVSHARRTFIGGAAISAVPEPAVPLSAFAAAILEGMEGRAGRALLGR